LRSQRGWRCAIGARGEVEDVGIVRFCCNGTAVAYVWGEHGLSLRAVRFDEPKWKLNKSQCGVFSMKKFLLMAGVAAALSAGSLSVKAQGNFDPAEMRARMMERAREVLDVPKDDEWKIVSERLEKVMTAQRDVRAFGGGGGFGFGGGRGGRRGGDQANAGGGQGGGRRGGGFFGEQPQEAKDLAAAVEAKAPADEMKAKLDKFRAAKKSKEEALAKAQASLKEVLNARQEAAAVMSGYLN
jgi:hypothetical protein